MIKRGIGRYLGHFMALVGIWVVAVGVAAYIFDHQLGVRIPFRDDAPFRLKMLVTDAQGVNPGQGQAVQVAGVTVGYVTGVELEDGRAALTLSLEPEYEGLVRSDATALMRSRTPVRDVLVEIAPGRGRPLEDGDTIPPGNTLPEVALDRIWAEFDRDTRDYLKLLITGAGTGMRGRGDDLSRSFRRLAPLHRDVVRVSGAIAHRRRSMRRLVNRYGRLMHEVGRSDRDISRLVRANDVALGAFASRRDDLSAAVAELPGALRQTQVAFERIQALSRQMSPTLTALRPAMRTLDPAMRALLPAAREATPILRHQIRPLQRLARPELRVLADASRDLAQAGPDLSKAFGRFNRLLNIFAFNPGGAEGLEGRSFDEQRARREGLLWSAAHAARAGHSVFSAANALGVFRRAFFVGTDCAVFRAQGLPQEAADLLGDAGVCTKTTPTSP